MESAWDPRRGGKGGSGVGTSEWNLAVIKV